MVMDDEIEKAVFALVEEYNGVSLFTFKRYKLTKDTDLNKDFKMAPEDAYELLTRYTELFSIDPQAVFFDKYFPEKKRYGLPLTIGMLIESAKAGQWLY